MAITSITITQDNKVGNSNLMPVHSPLVFLADVAYDSVAPTVIYIDVIADGDVIDTFKAIPFADPLGTIRTFAFVANDVIKGLMNGFDDFSQLNETIVFVEDITKEVTIKFRDPDDELTSDSVDVVLIHGAEQFGEYPNLVDVYNNEDQIYLGGNGSVVYVYFYNEDEANVLTIDSPTVNTEFAQDYDDEIFTDYDDTPFEIDIAI